MLNCSKALRTKTAKLYVPRQQSFTYQDGKGCPVVKPEGRVIDVALLDLEVARETSEHAIHLECGFELCSLFSKVTQS